MVFMVPAQRCVSAQRVSIIYKEHTAVQLGQELRITHSAVRMRRLQCMQSLLRAAWQRMPCTLPMQTVAFEHRSIGTAGAGSNLCLA